VFTAEGPAAARRPMPGQSSWSPKSDLRETIQTIATTDQESDRSRLS
jgi:hypothetical protein